MMQPHIKRRVGKRQHLSTGVEWRLVVGLSLCLVSLLCLHAQQSSGRRPAKSSRSAMTTVVPVEQQQAAAKQAYSLGIFYYHNDDISDKAATQFEMVRKKYPNTKEAESAQYYLASYYQRKYYIQREKWRKTDAAALGLAEKEYFAYIDRYSNHASSEWLSDSHFNLALVFLQWNKTDWAGDILQRMLRASNADRKVYLYQIIWSSNTSDVIDDHLDAGELARYTRTLVNNGQPFENNVANLRRWCQGQKSRKLKY